MSDAPNNVYVANTTFSTTYEGATHVIHKDKTRIRAGHPIVVGNPDYFDAVDLDVHYEWETATAAPGEKRGQTAEPHSMGGQQPQVFSAEQPKTPGQTANQPGETPPDTGPAPLPETVAPAQNGEPAPLPDTTPKEGEPGTPAPLPETPKPKAKAKPKPSASGRG